MNVLVACEESQEVCKAFRNRGHEAFSCDIIECSGGYPEWHIKQNVIPLLTKGYHFFRTQNGTAYCKAWDMIIAFPPCTNLAVSGARYFKEKREDGRQFYAINFFYRMINAECEKIAVENPIGIISGPYIKKWFNIQPLKPSQIIQPYQFGHATKKSTCLWLKNLPLLKPTEIVEPEIETYICSNGKKVHFGKNIGIVEKDGKILSWNDPETAKQRSKTFKGIALAMAEQWG